MYFIFYFLHWVELVYIMKARFFLFPRAIAIVKLLMKSYIALCIMCYDPTLPIPEALLMQCFIQ